LETLTELVAKISTDAAGLKSGLSDAEKKTEASSKEMQESLKAVGKVMVAVGGAITTAFALTIKSAMETQSVRVAFDNLTSSIGQSSDGIIRALQKASKGTVSEYDLMLSANRAMVLGVARNTEQFSSLMEIARDRARAMGLTTTQAFNDIVTGIGRGSPLILDNLGIIVNLTEANDNYAQQMGKTASSLTETEKQQALLNAVLEQGQKTIDKSAQTSMTASEVFQSMKASIADLGAQIGTFLLPIVTELFETIIKPVITKTKEWIDANPELTKTLVILSAALMAMTLTVGTLILAFTYLIPVVQKTGIAIKGAFGIVGWVMLAIEGLIMLGTFLWQNWDKVSKYFEVAVEAIVHAMGWLWDEILAYVNLLVDAIEWVMKALSHLVNFFSHDAAVAIWNAADNMANAFENFRDKSVKALNDFDANFSKSAEKVKEGVKDAAEDLKQSAGEIQYTMDEMGNVIASAAQKASAGWSTAAEEIIANWNKMAEVAQETARASATVGGGAGLQDYLAGIAAAKASAGLPIYEEGYITGWRGGEPAGAFTPTPKEAAQYETWFGEPYPYQKGGIIDRPTLALMGEQAPAIREAVIPETLWGEIGGGNVIVQFTQPVFFDREDTMNRFVDKIAKGLDRKYRLRFGRAYSG